MKIIPKNWQEFQHYKDRAPPWIKLHHKLLDNSDFNALPPMACKVLILIWLVASEERDGVVDGDPAELAFRLRLPPVDVAESLECLLAFGFVIPAAPVAEPVPEKSLAAAVREKNGFSSRYIPDQVRQEVWARDKGTCMECQSIENIEYDHITPVSKGGSSLADNVQLLCRSCNRKKRTKTAEQVATQAQPGLELRTTEGEREAEREKRQSPAAQADADSASTLGAAALQELKGKALTLDQAKIEGGEDTPAAILASVLFANGIKGNSFHPLVIEWARTGITVERLKEAIAKARQRPGKDKPGTFGCEYLDPILLDESKPAAQVQSEKASASAAKSVAKAAAAIAAMRKATETQAPMPEWAKKFSKGVSQ